MAEQVARLNGYTLPPRVEIVSAAEFLANLKPIESIYGNLPIGRGNVTCLTAKTGDGKTTLTALMLICSAMGLPIAGHESTRGGVLVLAGENPEDFGMHLLAALQELGINPEDVSREASPILVVPGTFDIDFQLDDIHARIKSQNVELVAVFVDTSAAFNMSDDENSNTALRAHASKLRGLASLPGRPAVVVLCHPVKSATEDNLLPRGAGAFLAEVDANLTLWRDKGSDVTTLSWAGKIRGRAFDPIKFELVGVEIKGIYDSRGKAVYSSIVRHIPEAKADQLQQREISDQDRLMSALRKSPGASVADLAFDCGWINADRAPLKSSTDRRLKVLEGLSLAQRNRHGKWSLTPKGQKDAESLPI